MATRKQLIDGFAVLEKYRHAEQDDDLCAEHDVIYVGGAPPEAMTVEDRAALDAVRFHWDAIEEHWYKFT